MPLPPLPPLTLTGFDILRALRARGEMTAVDLSAEVDSSLTAVKSALNRFRVIGLVASRLDSTPSAGGVGRQATYRAYYSLTPSGATLVTEAAEALRVRLDPAATDLPL